VGKAGVRYEGSVDMYYKGANIIHTVRQLINNDELFRQILRDMNKSFYQQTVTGKTVEELITTKSGKNLRNVFDQYLRTTKIPTLQYRQSGKRIQYRWANVVAGFDMPVKLVDGTWLTPITDWKTFTQQPGQAFAVDKNFYINLKKL
jgi:aminopeptidase N